MWTFLPAFGPCALQLGANIEGCLCVTYVDWACILYGTVRDRHSEGSVCVGCFDNELYAMSLTHSLKQKAGREGVSMVEVLLIVP